MKELSIKEKAEAYDEAKARMSKAYNSNRCTIGFMNEIFPELKESDEKIKEEIINYFECQSRDEPCRKSIHDKWIAWLEKQGQTFTKEDTDNANKVEPKFKAGNWYQCTKDFFGKGVTFDKNTAYYCAQEGCLQNEYGCHIAIVKDLYDNFKLWTIQDAKDGDVLFQDLMGGKTFIYNGINPDMAILYSFIINNDGEDVMPYHIGKPNTGIGYIEENKNIIHPATKEQCDTLFAKMHEAGYEWDAEKKELKKISQRMISAEAKEAMYGKPTAWSEEDENEVAILEAYIRSGEWSESHIDRALGIVDELVNKVKSLRPQKQWKPSEKQMEALNAINVTGGISYAGQGQELIDLYNDLKKLREVSYESK